jgi:hypothetical protein
MNILGLSSFYVYLSSFFSSGSPLPPSHGGFSAFGTRRKKEGNLARVLMKLEL